MDYQSTDQTRKPSSLEDRFLLFARVAYSPDGNSNRLVASGWMDGEIVGYRDTETAKNIHWL